MRLVVLLLAAQGLTTVVTTGRILAPLRDALDQRSRLARWLRCPMCFGFWTGLFWHVAGFGVAPGFGGFLASGFVASAWCWTSHVLLRRLGAHLL